MKVRSLGLLILLIGGMVIPCLLLTTLLAPQRVPAAIQIATDAAWATAIEQSLLYQGYEVIESEIVDEGGGPTNRTLIVSLADLREGEVQAPTDLVDLVHYSIGEGFADWPIAPSDIGIVKLWIYPTSGPPYGVVASVVTLTQLADGVIEWKDYHAARRLGNNAPAELRQD